MCLSENVVVRFPCLDSSEAMRAQPVPGRGAKTLAVTQLPGMHTDGLFDIVFWASISVDRQRLFFHD